MRFEGWKIDHFGVLKDFAVRDLPKGITLFQGPNESGKSTLLGFLRCMLFGFSDLRGSRRRKNLYPPLGEGRYGGTLFLQTEDGVVALDREVGKKNFQLTLPDGKPGDAEDLTRLLGPADRKVYETVFAFSIDELALLKTLGTEGVKDRIFAASIGDTGRKARALLNDLREEASRIFDEKGPGPKLAAYLAQWEVLEKPLRKAEKAALNYPALRLKRAACLGAREALIREQETARQDEAVVKVLIELWDSWKPVLKMREELNRLPSIDDFVENPEARLEERTGAVRSVLEKQVRLKTDREQCEEECTALKNGFDETCFAMMEEVTRW
ncbi:MAG: AAA family ATPase, partial [Planctomycetes bacterium]|nr:AAA family ATPase [Planctomycetota bacterium]